MLDPWIAEHGAWTLIIVFAAVLLAISHLTGKGHE